MRHLPAHVREKMERKFEREERMTPEQLAAQQNRKAESKKEKQLLDPHPVQLTLPMATARALAEAQAPVLRHQREHGRFFLGGGHKGKWALS